MKLLNPPISLCSEILEFVYEFDSRIKKCDLTTIKAHFDKSPKYFNLAFSFLTQCNLVTQVDEIVTLSPESKKILTQSSSNSKRLVYEKLMTVQPFIEYSYFLGKGKDKKESAKLVKSLYEIKQDDDSIIRIFDSWIKLLGIKITDRISENKTLQGLKASLQNKLYANNFIKENLAEYLRFVSEKVIDELSTAVKTIPENNKESVNAAGRALEDFLRVDLAKDIDLTKCSGIGEIAIELNRDQRYPKKLNNLCIGLASVRSMGNAHGLDKSLKLDWSITENSAIAYILMVISIIKSYLQYKNESKLVF